MSEITDKDKDALLREMEGTRSIVAIETVTVPFGRFEAYRIEETVEVWDWPIHSLTEWTIWERPEMGPLR